MTTNGALSRLSDTELLNEVKRLAAIEREATADLIRSLAEVETRQLHLASGCSSMFSYCTQVLRLSEHAAYARIAAARAASRFPLVMDLLINGAITLTTVTLLGRHLTDENHARLLEAARHKSKADVEVLVAALHPQRDVPSSVRKLPPPKLPATTTAPLSSNPTEFIASPSATPRESSITLLPPVLLRPIAPERYTLKVTITAETRAKLRRAQDLIRHTKRSADEAAVLDRALTVLVEQLERVKYGRTDRPRSAGGSDPTSRYVSAELRRAVSGRDGDRCAFIGSGGRCPETAGLQYHHRIPFADGGPTTVENLELRCPAHNAYEAERWFGPLFVRETLGAWPAHRSARREGGGKSPLGLDQVPLGAKARSRCAGVSTATWGMNATVPLMIGARGLDIRLRATRNEEATVRGGAPDP